MPIALTHRVGLGTDRQSFDLMPVDSEHTVVTETFDCTDSPDWLQEATQDGEGWIDAMTATLKNLETAATD